MADGAYGPITDVQGALRRLPSVQSLLEHPSAAQALRTLGHTVLTQALRHELARLRAGLLAGAAHHPPDAAHIVALATAACRQPEALRRVVNATGIVVHTNLGRAPLAEAAALAAAEAARSACNLEFDLQTGRRGQRGAGAEALLCRLTGAQAALAVNNNAAAMLLALAALAGPGAEVVVSRGELVEIGGGFRIPDIITQGGARLVEVGTTNKTRLADYEAAITPHTRLLLKVHQSNFRMIGFTAEASLTELAGLARARGLLLLDDLGSGTLAHLPGNLAQLEPTVRESLDAGTDLVAFSGDKLLGGPQSGLLAGRAEVVDRLRRHPLMRALRLDKMTLAALEATLRLHTDPARVAEIPVLRMLAQTEPVLAARADRLCAMLAGTCVAELVASIGHAGGGALPGQDIPSRAVRLVLAGCSPDALAGALRAQAPAVVGRIHDGQLLLDVLSVADAELPDLAASVAAALSTLRAADPAVSAAASPLRDAGPSAPGVAAALSTLRAADPAVSAATASPLQDADPSAPGVAVALSTLRGADQTVSAAASLLQDADRSASAAAAALSTLRAADPAVPAAAAAVATLRDADPAASVTVAVASLGGADPGRTPG